MPLAASNTPAAVASTAGVSGGIFQAMKPGTTQTVSITGTSAATTNAVGTSLIRVVSTTDCHVVLGTSPTATTSNAFLPANTVEYFSCNADEKVAFIQSAASGTAYVTAAATAL